jgi:hypothetical protein
MGADTDASRSRRTALLLAAGRWILRRWAPLLVLAGASLAVAVSAHTPEMINKESRSARKRNHDYQGLRVIRDDWDRYVYFMRGSFAVKRHARPYVDVESEYPQLATYYFALPLAFTRDDTESRNLFSLSMALFLGATALLVSRMCRRFDLSQWRVLALLLPGTLFFTINRFDMLPAFLCLAATALLLSRRTRAAFAVLALAVLTKVYPVVYLPFFIYWTWQERRLKDVGWGLASFALVIFGFSLQLALWTSWKTVAEPILFQGERMANAESLYYFVGLAIPEVRRVLGRRLFQLLQVAPALAVLIFRPRDPRDLLRWMTVVTLTMVLFARFHSPQWLLWFSPLALIACATGYEIALLVASDILTYLYFPIAYDLSGPRSPLFSMILGLLIAVRLVFVISLLRPVAWARPTLTSASLRA